MENWGCDRFLGLKNCCWPPEIIFLMIDLTIRDPLDYWVFAWASPHLQQIAEGFSHVFTNNLCSPWDKDMVMGQELRPFWRMYPDFHLYNAQRMGVSENGAYHPNAFPKALIFGQTQIWYRCLNMPPISPKKSPLDTHPPQGPTPTRCAPGHLHHAVLHQEADGFTHTTTAQWSLEVIGETNHWNHWHPLKKSRTKYYYGIRWSAKANIHIYIEYSYIYLFITYIIYIYTYKISSSYHFLPKLMLQGP